MENLYALRQRRQELLNDRTQSVTLIDHKQEKFGSQLIVELQDACVQFDHGFKVGPVSTRVFKNDRVV